MEIVMDIETTRKRVRAADPATSVLAAEKATFFAGSHKAKIFSVLVQHESMTADEISERTGLTVVQVDRRLPELQRDGFVRVLQHDGCDMVRNGFRVWEAV